MKNKIAIPVALILFCIPLFTIWYCYKSDERHSHFNTYEEALQSESWNGLWLPRNLPKDAKNIFEMHRVDDPSRIAFFVVEDDFKKVLDTTCTIKKGFDIKYSRLKSEWWPMPLFGNAFGSSHEFHYYQCNDGNYAIPFLNKKMIYYWKNEAARE